MTRVLSVIHSPFFGGPHNQVLRLDEPLRARGFVTLAVVPDEPGNAYDRLSDGGVDVVRLRLGRLRAKLDWRVQRSSLRALAGDVPRLAELIRERDIELVLLHGSLNLQAAVAARRCRRPAVVQVLDTRTPRALRYLSAPFLRGLATTVMTTGRAVAAAHPWLPRDPSRCFVFFPPVDTTAFRPDGNARRAVRAELGFQPDDVVVGCVANLTPQKGLEAFVEVAERISATHTNVRFALFGRTMETQRAYAERVVSRAAPLIDDDRLLVRDVGTGVPRHVRALDVFLATAVPRSEGISTTILEAMSAGVPVVSTDVGAIREAIVDGATGLLAPPSDTPALVRCVTRLVDAAADRASMGEAARERAVREFDVERCADVHARAFAAALRR
jgi:glycosyltransferase involved in cell wall biosynthesis